MLMNNNLELNRGEFDVGDLSGYWLILTKIR